MRRAAGVSICALLGAALLGAAPLASHVAAQPASAARRADMEVAALRRTIDSLVTGQPFANARWGVLVVRPSTGDTLYSRDAGKLFMPASNQKLVTGAAALERFGPDHRMVTSLAVRGRLRGGVVTGDLVVLGGGDPTMSDRARGDALAPLRDLADSLAARGVRRVTGRLVSAGARIPGDGYGFGWAYDDLDEPYSAPVDALLFNEGIARLVVRGGARGGVTPTVSVQPAAGIVPVRVRARTVAGVGRETAPTAHWVGGAYEVVGAIAPRDSVVLAVAIREPGRAWLTAFHDVLRAKGIRVAGGIRVDTVRSESLHTLVTLASPPLRAVLALMEKDSQNQIAEVLFRLLGAELRGAGTPETGRTAIEAQIAQWGIDSSAIAVRDGSGLSRHDYATPETIVRVLDAMRRHVAFDAFRESLPIAGVDGTLATRMRGTPAQGNVRAKTGFVDKARSLSGYVTTADGELLLFSILCNNWTTPTAAVNAVQDTIASRLAGLHLRDDDAQRR